MTDRRNRNRKLGRVAKEEKEPAIEKVSRILDVPQGVLHNLFHMEITGNREVTVEGCSGVLEYSNDVIRLGGGNMVIKITGRNLQIRCMTADSAVINGYILSFEFVN